ncbi:MAG: hypothetical protein BZY88_18120 [SAR202 cluster bacterium Io17-Chloro-G9]|nr:MAG: hypothetical protein BZY88_18120 [SAR202 cluster bacterium Io17-Chloro-G9]
MNRVVGIRWRKGEPLIYADAGDLAMKRNAMVVVQADKCQEMAWVVREPANLIWSENPDPSALTVLRRATASDIGRLQQVKEMEEEAFRLARTKVRELNLPMKIVEAHYAFDRSRLTVSFGAQGRVDFRPLLRELGAALGCRVELRQIGDRDVAKITGGLGRCGRTLCCESWMTKFDAISIRMAKEQALPISADGLAGACGRLRCCLRFEYEQYRQVNRSLPRIGEEVSTPNGTAKVIVGHRIKETVSVRYEDDRVLEWPLAEVERLASAKN